MDLFAGTGTIGFNSLSLFRTVSANDWEYYSYVINTALISVPFTDTLAKKIEECNVLEPVKGFIYTELAPHSEEAGCENRMFFTVDNAKKADAIRQYLNKEKDKGYIDEKEYLYLLASLLTSIDKVANTTSVYGSFLKKFKASARKPLQMVPIHTRRDIPHKDNHVFHGKAEDIQSYYDVVYLDPPYNQRQYAANYSPLNFIAEYNSEYKIKGKTALLEGYNKSDFCSKTKVKNAFEILLKSLNTKYIFLSYNNEGILSMDVLQEILLAKGDVTLYTIPYKKYKSNSNESSTDTVYEYLWFIDTTVKKKPGNFTACL